MSVAPDGDRTVYYAWNETFHCYHELPLAGKRAHAFIAKRNEEKGGTWVLHTAIQYREWYERIGQHKEFL